MQLNYWLSRLVQSCPFASLSLSRFPSRSLHASISCFFRRSQGACYSSSNSTWQGDLCPTQDGLNWGGGRGGGSHVPCPTLWSLHLTPHPPAQAPAQAPALACKGRERQWRQPAPLCWAPCWTLERGKRRGRERPTQTHTKSPVYVYAEFDRECTFSSTQCPAHRKPTGQTTDMRVEVGANAPNPRYITSINAVY